MSTWEDWRDEEYDDAVAEYDLRTLDKDEFIKKYEIDEEEYDDLIEGLI